MTRRRYGLCLWIAFVSCTDLGVVGEQRRPSAGAGGAQHAGASGANVAAGSGGSEPCPFGVCELPPFCTAPDAFCILCESDADCVRDPVERFCSPLFSTCVACVTDADCDPETPYCDGGECGLCNEDDHCPEGQSCNDGRCERD